MLDAAVEAEITFFDTADVYGDGRSEQLIGRFLADNPDQLITVATKMGRRVEQMPENYVLDNFRAWTDRSRRNLGVDQLDLVQLHCPPTRGLLHTTRSTTRSTPWSPTARSPHYGVSVETCDEALTAISRRGTATVQIILNAFRLKPLEEVLPRGRDAGVGIIARVPLASGLLSGRYTARHDVRAERPPHATTVTARRSTSARRSPASTSRPASAAAAEFTALVEKEFGAGVSPAQAALAWVVDSAGVSTVIPGARSVEQARSNAAAGSHAPLSPTFVAALADLYDRMIRPSVHASW